MRRDSMLPAGGASPIFVGGQRRSGTTLFRTMLDRHPHVSCGHETHLVKALHRWHDRLADGWSQTMRRYGFDKEVLNGSLAALVESLLTRHRLLQGKQRWADKTPGNMLYIDYLFGLFPHAQFVHMIRDPRDTFCSMRNRAQADRPKWKKYTLAHCATEWRAMIEAGKRWRARSDRYMEVRYEELVREPETTFRRVLVFLHEPWDPAVLTTDVVQGQARRPETGRIFTSSIGRWKAELTSAEVREIESRAGELMVELGYPLVTG